MNEFIEGQKSLSVCNNKGKTAETVLQTRIHTQSGIPLPPPLQNCVKYVTHKLPLYFNMYYYT